MNTFVLFLALLSPGQLDSREADDVEPRIWTSSDQYSERITALTLNLSGKTKEVLMPVEASKRSLIRVGCSARPDSREGRYVLGFFRQGVGNLNLALYSSFTQWQYFARRGDIFPVNGELVSLARADGYEAHFTLVEDASLRHLRPSTDSRILSLRSSDILLSDRSGMGGLFGIKHSGLWSVGRVRITNFHANPLSAEVVIQPPVVGYEKPTGEPLQGAPYLLTVIEGSLLASPTQAFRVRRIVPPHEVQSGGSKLRVVGWIEIESNPVAAYVPPSGQRGQSSP